MIDVLENIKVKLIENLNATEVKILNKSASHADHYQSNNDFPTHIHIIITSDILKNMSQVDSHRQIYAQLSDEFANGLHAVSIEIK